jgi:hypothetical protein
LHRTDGSHKAPYGYMTGHGTAKDVVHTVCAAVKETGGLVVR